MKQSLLVGLILLSGCILNPPLPARPPAPDISSFAFVGRLAIRQGESRHHVTLDWRHAGSRDDILLKTPLGQGVASLTRDTSGARLVLADRREFAANDWSELAEQVFGFRLPLDSATHWVTGREVEGTDWRIHVVERESTQADALPSIIELERADIFVRLKIDEWLEAK